MSAAGVELKPLSKRDALFFLYKYRRRFLLAFFTPCILSISAAVYVTPRYEADAVLIVRLGAEYVYNPELSDARDGSNNVVPYNINQIFKPEVAILSSDDLHKAVIRKLGMDELFPDMNGIFSSIRDKLNALFEEKPTQEETERRRLARAVAMFDKRFDILLDKDSSVITVSFTHRDATMAAQALNTLLKLYEDKRRTVYSEPRTELARGALQVSREQADKAEHALQQFKYHHNIHALADERALLLARRDKDEEQASRITSEGLTSRIAEDTKRLEKLDSLEHQLTLLQKEATNAEDSYALYSRKYNEAKAFDALEKQRLDGVRIAQSPTVSAEPNHIRLWILLSGAFLSIMSLCMTAAVTRFLKNSFFTATEVEEGIELRVLASFAEAKHIEHEAMQRLMDNLGTADNNLRIITFMAARSGEGTSHIAWNYAAKLAQETGRKILLIEAGRVSNRRSREYGYISGNGIIDAFVDNKPLEECISEIGKGLSVCRLVRAERNHGRVSEIVADKEFWKGLSELSRTIVIDAGALQQSSDSILLAAKSTAAVVVIEAERTPPEVVRHLCASLKWAGAKVIGGVLNRRQYHIPEAIYRRL